LVTEPLTKYHQGAILWFLLWFLLFEFCDLKKEVRKMATRKASAGPKVGNKTRKKSATEQITRQKTRQKALKQKPNNELSFLDQSFLTSPDARALRILAEYLEPEARFKAAGIQDTIVFFGSARIQERKKAERALKSALNKKIGVAAARQRLRTSRYYEEARELSRRLTEWSKSLEKGQRYVVCTGGGPGIMEAANRGAHDAKGINIGLNIALPFEQAPNRYITPELSLMFHYFFMRKFWFAYFAKAMVFMPGGFGTLDEVMEVLTLCQTLKLKKRMPIVLYGQDFWRKALDLNSMVGAGTIARKDLDLIQRVDSVDEAFDFITKDLSKNTAGKPGGTLEHWHDIVSPIKT
jgi:hypothetical protein